LGMSYRKVLRWLFSLRRFGSKPGLEHISYLLGLMGDPHMNFKSIHITGTNGKGSTTAMVASILGAAGYSVGMFTSPHLSSFTERIVVDGEPIPPYEVVRIMDEIMPLIDHMLEDPGLRHPTFFEVITALAFKYFSERGVDFAVLEVGMGGRLDATNVVHALVSVITNVSLEHTEVLGDTVLEIAEKKAGIIKKGGILITATQDDDVFNMFKEVCRQVGSRIFRVDRDIRFTKFDSSFKGQSFQLNGLLYKFEVLFIPLLGDYQLLNASTAVGAVEALSFHEIKIPQTAIEKGLRMVNWPGRLEIVQRNPTVILDCAKDVEAAKAVKETLLNEFIFDRLIAVVSISSDKKIQAMIEQFAQAADFFVLTSHSVMGRAADPTLLSEEVEKHNKPYEVVPDVKEAVRRGIEIADKDDFVIIVGSVFLVGEAREIWFKPAQLDP